MKRTFFLLIIFILSVYFGVYFNGQTGTVLIVFKHWVIEMSLLVTLFGIAACLFLLSLLYVMIAYAFALPTRLIAHHRAKKATLYHHVTEKSVHALGTQDPIELMKLLPSLKKTHLLSNELLDVLYFNSVLREANLLSDSGAFDTLFALIAALPKKLQETPQILQYTIDGLIQKKQTKKALHQLSRALKKQFDGALLERYVHLVPRKTAILFLEKLIKKHPTSYAIYTKLGLLYCEEKLWGKAKDVLDESLAIQETPEAYLALAHLFEDLSEEKKAANAYQRGLKLALQPFNFYK